MIDSRHHPSPRELRMFAVLVPVFFAIVGALRWHAGSPRAAQAVWLSGLVLTVMLVALPRSRRSLYVGWMMVLYPVSWVVSHLILAMIFFLVATPIAFALRAAGRDPMKRRFEATAKTYWQAREPAGDPKRYFRQF